MTHKYYDRLQDLYNISEQRLNNDGDISGYILPESYREEGYSLIKSIQNSDDELLKSRLRDAPIYTQSQWETYDFIDDIFKIRLMNEEWVTAQTGSTHFTRHCLGGGNYTSKQDDIYYDFNTEEEYSKFEDETSRLALNADIIINTIADDKMSDLWSSIVNYLNDGKSVLLTKDCGFRGKTSLVQYGFVPNATPHTTNFGNTPTVSFIVLTPDDNKTINLYPMAIDYIPSRMSRMANKNRTGTTTNAQRLNAFNDMKVKLSEIHFDDIVKKYMRTGPYDYPGEVLFPNKYFFVNSHAYPYKPRNAEEDVEPVTATVFTIKSKDNREVSSGRLYAQNEEEFRKNIEDALNTVESELKKINQI